MKEEYRKLKALLFSKYTKSVRLSKDQAWLFLQMLCGEEGCANISKVKGWFIESKPYSQPLDGYDMFIRGKWIVIV